MSSPSASAGEECTTAWRRMFERVEKRFPQPGYGHSCAGGGSVAVTSALDAGARQADSRRAPVCEVRWLRRLLGLRGVRRRGMTVCGTDGPLEALSARRADVALSWIVVACRRWRLLDYGGLGGPRELSRWSCLDCREMFWLGVRPSWRNEVGIAYLERAGECLAAPAPRAPPAQDDSWRGCAVEVA